MRKTLCVLLVVLGAMAGLASTATAGTGPADTATARSATTGWVQTPDSGVTPQALTCSSGNLCVWPVTDGSRNRCSWLNRDNDWWNTPVVCSWSSSQTVKAIYNRGTSSSFSGVCLYANANYSHALYYVPQGQQFVPGPQYVVRSHRWVSSNNECWNS
ncbi:peptidase inhibitor family I36 protein [Lentzea flaviverrucosa]|uniref:Peptidase inhibitor family I36 n=1 Tax=Lentzea flaviverrucosa TaxID=200379 RepID=A0A1H9BTY5_9PSEU|nr:peptidase inhibitor family I36 protein [Lentzea flaviverrucosa]RDI31690.1 peptidase inhibitor family I36 [Lentzea flaviverrucosa]SEP91768.1 Peptidase inhibitor family I36 [Lentzea flaviverrucosa]